jgi:protein TonB
LLQPSLLPATPLADRLRIGAGRRTLAVGLVLLIELLLLLLLLSLGAEKQAGKKQESITVVNVEAARVSEETPEPSSPEPRPQEEERPQPPRPPAGEKLPPRPAEPLPPAPVAPRVIPTAPAIIPTPDQRPPSADTPREAAPPAPAPKRVYGPPDRGGSPALRDSERVGTAPNGEPLYAAAWYREPRPEQLRAYLSTASGPGWGLIACRTAPDYRVEDCVGLDEYPTGSQITRAVLAAAWEFKVRPPRLGGRPLVGSWVRIRIDYGIDRR